MKNKNVLILGAGISGLGAAYSLRQKGYKPIILEKDDTYGGLCGNFTFNGFRFDRFVHLSFAKDKNIVELLNKGAIDVITHIPNPYNIYKRKWIKHPAQNNLYPLDTDEKKIIIDDFINRPQVNMSEIVNYEEWLRIQYGNYFAENFPMVYTRKYWMCDAKDLRTEWVGNRLYQPSVEEVINGAESSETPITYYAKEMRYPKKGGYKQFLTELAKDNDIRYNEEICKIDIVNKIVIAKNGNKFNYDTLISSFSLKEYPNLIDNMPLEIIEAFNRLQCTSGYHISIGLKTKNIPPYLWWYIYDEDLYAARVYSPSLKSTNNAPKGCSSLQMEVYCKQDKYTQEQLYSGTVEKLIELCIIKREDILFTHIGFEKYANVIFNKTIFEDRKIVREYLESIGIETIGRFGEWEYFWSDQSLQSGLNVNLK